MLSRADGEIKHWWEIFFGRDLPGRTRNINLVTYELLLEHQRQQDKLDFESRQKAGKTKGESFNPDAELEIKYGVRNFQRYLDEEFEVIYDGVMRNGR